MSEAVRLLVAELGETPLIGFAGAPFTLASYLVEGGPSRDYARDQGADARRARRCGTSCAPGWPRSRPPSWRSRSRAGAAAVQLFDSWAGSLPAADYRDTRSPTRRAVLERIGRLGVPRIHFGVGTSELLGLMGAGRCRGGRGRLAAAAGRGEPPARAGRYAVQGNLDPALLAAPWPVLAERIREVIRSGADAPGHIFNLGHGVPPDADPDVLARIVDLVQAEGAELRARARRDARRDARRRRRRRHHGLGGGPPARRRGCEVTLLEARRRWGGKLATVRLDGVRLDGGAESVLARRPERSHLMRRARAGRERGPSDRRQAARSWSTAGRAGCRRRCRACRRTLERLGRPVVRRRVGSGPPGAGAAGPALTGDVAIGRLRRRAVRGRGDRSAAGAAAGRGLRRPVPASCPSPRWPRACSSGPGPAARCSQPRRPRSATGRPDRCSPGWTAASAGWSTPWSPICRRAGSTVRTAAPSAVLAALGGGYRLTVGPVPAPRR